MDQLIKEIVAYCNARGITPGTFGSYALKDGKFFGRISEGGECLPRIAAKARQYIAENPAPPSEASATVGG